MTTFQIDNPPWAPITPYLTYSEQQQQQRAQEEITAIFSQPRTAKYTNPGVITSPESYSRTSTNLITTPESSVASMPQSQRSSQTDHTQSQSSSRTNSPPPPPVPPPPAQEVAKGIIE